MSTPLSEVFSTEADAKIIESAQAEEVIQSEEVTGEETAEVEAEEIQAKAEDVEAAPPAEKPAKSGSEVDAFKAMALDERAKRQALEQQLQQFNAKQAEKPDAYVEPDKAIEHEVGKLKQDFENRFLNMSEFNARSRHGDDFDQMTEVFFSEMVSQNPSLQQAAMQHPDPYEYIYQQAKTHVEFKGVSSITDLKAKMEAEIRQKLEAEFAEKQKQLMEQAINSKIPPSLSTSTAVGGTVSKGYSGPTPLNKIFSN